MACARFNTGNPVLPCGSADAKDLSDNAPNLDLMANDLINDTFTDRLGNVRDTANGRLKKMGYAVPIVYAGGELFELADNVKTVDEGGIVYAPLPSALPFTTSGTFVGDDDARFFVVQGLTLKDSLGYFTATYKDISNMIANPNSIPYIVDMPLKVQGEDGSYDNYIVVNSVSDIDLGGGFWAKILPAKSLDEESVLFPVVRQTNDNAIPAANLLASLRSNGTRVNLVPIGDSFGDGVGANVYDNRYVNVLNQMLNNSSPEGYGIGTHARLAETVNYAGSGFTSDGTLNTNGALESQLRLLAGEILEITGFELDFADLWYFGATTTGDLNIYLNGTQINTIVTTKVGGVLTTFSSNAMPRRTESTDVIRFEAAGGQVDITGFNPTRTSVGGAYQLAISHGGWSYKTYDNQLIVDEIVAYASFSAGAPVYMFQLGTNSIYNASESQTPTDMIASLVSFIAKLEAGTPGAGYIVCVPPQANEGVFPVIQPGFTYEDYQTALINYGDVNGVQLIRLDQSNLVKFGMLPDGVHPSDAGHILLAQIMANALGLSETAYKLDPTTPSIARSVPTFNDLWGDFGGDSGVKLTVENNTGTISGFAARNGSAVTTIGAIPLDFRPKNRDPQFICVTNNGSTTIAIDKTTGNIIVTGTAVDQWVALEITYPINAI